MAFEEARELVTLAKQAAARLDELDQPIRCVAHYDCDGISSGVIVHKALERAGKTFDITFVEELDRDVLERLEQDCLEHVFLFVDIGSGQIDDVADVLDNREVIIADHHEPGDATVDIHVNPHLVDIDGGEAISGAGVTYLVMRLLDERNTDLLKYALIGATGDIQKENGAYLGLNEGLMEDAEERGLVERKKGLNMYGRSRKRIVDALQYTTNPYLPGISNNESGAVQFLSSLGIDLHDENGDWRTLEDLSFAEEQEIVHGLITKGYDVGGLLGNIYILDNGWEIGEFASLMNACGRLGNPENGVKICLEQDFELAEKIKRKYGRKIGKYLSFVEENKDNSDIVKREGSGALIVARDRIHANMIGTVTTICQKSDILAGDVLVGMAYKGQDDIKLSARATQTAVNDGLVMSDLMEDLCTVCDGDGGGHEAAAGGKIPRSEEDRFIKLMRDVLTTDDSDGKDRTTEGMV